MPPPASCGVGGRIFDLEKYNRASVDFIQFTRTLHLKTIKLLSDAPTTLGRQKVSEFLDYALQGDPAVMGFRCSLMNKVSFSLVLAQIIKRKISTKIIILAGRLWTARLIASCRRPMLTMLFAMLPKYHCSVFYSRLLATM